MKNWKDVVKKYGPGVFAVGDNEAVIAWGANMEEVWKKLEKDKIDVGQVKIIRLPPGRWRYNKD